MHDSRMLAWSHIYLGRIFDIQQNRDVAVEHYQAALAAGDPSADTRAAAERGLAAPYQAGRARQTMKKPVKKAILIVSLMCLGATGQSQQPSGGSSKQGQPAGKHVPQAKTHPEFNDYNTAYAVAGGAASEKAADEFSAKYPASELKGFLYAKAMHEYQTENNKTKILVHGREGAAV